MLNRLFSYHLMSINTYSYNMVEQKPLTPKQLEIEVFKIRIKVGNDEEDRKRMLCEILSDDLIEIIMDKQEKKFEDLVKEIKKKLEKEGKRGANKRKKRYGNEAKKTIK